MLKRGWCLGLTVAGHVSSCFRHLCLGWACPCFLPQLPKGCCPSRLCLHPPMCAPHSRVTSGMPLVPQILDFSLLDVSPGALKGPRLSPGHLFTQATSAHVSAWSRSPPPCLPAQTTDPTITNSSCPCRKRIVRPATSFILETSPPCVLCSPPHQGLPSSSLAPLPIMAPFFSSPSLMAARGSYLNPLPPLPPYLCHTNPIFSATQALKPWSHPLLSHPTQTLSAGLSKQI